MEGQLPPAPCALLLEAWRADTKAEGRGTAAQSEGGCAAHVAYLTRTVLYQMAALLGLADRVRCVTGGGADDAHTA